MAERAYPISDPRAPDYDGTPVLPHMGVTERDLPPGHPRAIDNPRRDTRPEESLAWVTAFNPPGMQHPDKPAPPPPGQPLGHYPEPAQPEQG